MQTLVTVSHTVCTHVEVPKKFLVILITFNENITGWNWYNNIAIFMHSILVSDKCSYS